MPGSRRVSVTLDSRDQEAIEVFADPARPEHAALRACAAQLGLSVRDDSDAAVLRALVRVGVQALRMRALDEGYVRLAASQSEDRDERRALRDRAIARVESRY